MEDIIDVCFVQLHTDLFLAGTNWGLKLYPKQTKGALGMTYNMNTGRVTIKHKEHTAYVNESSVAYVHPMPKTLEAAMVVKQEAVNPMVNPPAKKPGRPSAQVSGPTDHVFGTAPGKVRD
jgi:hypothetical protein